MVLVNTHCLLLRLCPTRSTLFPYTTLFRSDADELYRLTSNLFYRERRAATRITIHLCQHDPGDADAGMKFFRIGITGIRSEEHTSELQSPDHLVCRLLLEKKKNSVTLTSIS